MENNKLDKRTKWSYCIGATGRDMAYALVSMFLLTYIQYTMKLTVAQYAVISAIMVVCLLWDAINDPMMGIIIENSHLKAGKFKPLDFYRSNFKQPGNYLPVYSKTGRMGICRIFWSGISFMGNDLHNE